ncbi:MAG TPA: 50S ribosomal protein L25 [Candidatus Hydrogenedentes bacterium]|jgi:large subunit ribosomal protein L25|nr:50S ribosomal protein L25 [Candidatus Hydrogenedentota bacterium]
MQTLKAKKRALGSGSIKTNMRLNGGVPSVLYGEAKEALSIEVEAKAVEKLLREEGSSFIVLQLDFEDAPELNTPALVKEIQRHPVKSNLLHMDFMRVRLDERIHLPVPVILVGRAQGVIDGGVIDQQLREVQVECLAAEVPEHLELDVTTLGLGGTLHVADLAVPEGVTVLTEAGYAIVSIHAPRTAKGDEEADAEDAEGGAADES